MNRPLIIVLGLAGLTAAGAGTWAWTASQGGAAASTLPPEYSAAALKQQAETNPAQMGQTMRKAFEDESLTPEQRDELRRNTREAFQSVMQQRIEEYFSAPEADRVAVLDRQIDEFMQRMEEMRQERERQRAQDEKDGVDEEGRRQRWREAMGGGAQTAEQRKTRSESRNPDEMVRMMAYFQAAHARMQERGIQPPGGGPWGGGPGGGWGRGPGGPGGGG